MGLKLAIFLWKKKKTKGHVILNYLNLHCAHIFHLKMGCVYIKSTQFPTNLLFREAKY